MTTVAYRIRRSSRARRARIVIDGDGIEVVVPPRFPDSGVERLVEEKGPWIERTLSRMAQSHAAQPPARLVHGAEIPYLGERLRVRVRPDPARSRSSVSRRGQVLEVAARPERLFEAVERWYRARAREEVAHRLDRAAGRAGVAYDGLQIRGQRTRWASCSSTGAMSFNWRLLLAPVEILDYVVEHEVVHLEVLDHSERFWSLLGARCPEWRERERWLRDHGHALRLV